MTLDEAANIALVTDDRERRLADRFYGQSKQPSPIRPESQAAGSWFYRFKRPAAPRRGIDYDEPVPGYRYAIPKQADTGLAPKLFIV